MNHCCKNCLHYQPTQGQRDVGECTWKLDARLPIWFEENMCRDVFPEEGGACPAFEERD